MEQFLLAISVKAFTSIATTFRVEDFEAIAQSQGLFFLLPDFLTERLEDFPTAMPTIELIFLLITTPLPLLLLIFAIDVLAIILLPFIFLI